MLLGKTIHTSQNFFHKTFQSLKSFVVAKHQRLPKFPPFNPFCCINNFNFKIHELDQNSQGGSNQDKARKQKKKSLMSLEQLMKEEDACRRSLTDCKSHPPARSKKRKEDGKKKVMGVSYEERGEPSARKATTGRCVLAEKMKDLKKMEGCDVDQLLDIEEVLHYYARLKNPVYVNIVDMFFRDMYWDFLHQQPFASNKDPQ